MKNIISFILFSLIYFIYSCIGIDYVNDRVDPAFSFLGSSENPNDSIQELKVGDTPFDLSRFTIRYINYVGETVENPALLWESSNSSVLSISGNKSAIAVAHGNAYLRVSTTSEEGYTLKDSTNIRICEQSLKSITITDGVNDYTGIINESIISFRGQLVSGGISISSISIQEDAISTLVSGDSLKIGANPLQITSANGCVERYTLDIEGGGIANNDLLSLILTANNQSYEGIISGNSITFSSQAPFGTTIATISSINISKGAMATISGIPITAGETTISMGTNNIITITSSQNISKNYRLQFCGKNLSTITISDGINSYNGIINQNIISFEGRVISGNPITISSLVISQGSVSSLVSGNNLKVGANTLQITSANGCINRYTLYIEEKGSINNDLLSIVLNANNQNYEGIISGNSITFLSQVPFGITIATISSINISNGAAATIGEMPINTGETTISVGENHVISVTSSQNITKNYTLQFCRKNLNTITISDGINSYTGMINQDIISFEGRVISGNPITISSLVISQGSISSLVSGDNLTVGANTLQITSANGCINNYTINVQGGGIANNDLLSLILTVNNQSYEGIISGNSITFSSQAPFGTTIATISSINISNGAAATISGLPITAGETTIFVGIDNTITITSSQNISKNYTLYLTASSNTTSFSGSVQGGYGLRGDFTVEKTLSGIRISFADNYNLSSGLPGGYLYLSNNPNSTGLVVAGYNTTPALQYKGAHSYEVNNVEITDYKYLVFWCLPYNAKVGHGQIY